MPLTPSRHRAQTGSALIATLLVLLVMLTLGAGAISFSALDLKVANSDHTGRQAFYAAEAGIQDALNRINRIGVIDFQNDIVNRWNLVYGANPKSIANFATLQYSVATPANAGAGVWNLISTGTGPSNARRTISVGLRRGPIAGSPGAVYLASDNVSAQFSGNAFLVDGNDHDLNASLIAGGETKPGIATRADAVTSQVTGALSDGQKDNVLGLGFSSNPLSPSVMTAAGPSNADLTQLIADLLAKPHVDWTSSGISAGTTLGTVASPQITYLTQSEVTINGNASGAGVLIADGSVTINGNFNFVGWIIVRGSTTINSGPADDGTTVIGNATLVGSLWTGDFDIKIGGSCIVDYSRAAMELANATGGGNATPATMTITSWSEVY